MNNDNTNESNKQKDTPGNKGAEIFAIDRLGDPRYDSPIKGDEGFDSIKDGFVADDAKIVFDCSWENVKTHMDAGTEPPLLEVAGPREKIFFNASKVRAAIVNCGGLCPGLNDVIRALVMQLVYRYKVREVLGIRYGYQGLVPRVGEPPITMTPDIVSNIHRDGGTFLGSSRGPQDPAEIVDFLERSRINMLFTIGGDGTQRGALDIANEVEKRGLEIGVVGIPKTIDNDISHVERSFGFNTAVAIANDVLLAGHEEARGAKNGVCVVKLMGRKSGFIAAMAAVANGDANFVLVPEVKFELEGPNGLYNALERRLENRKHALVVVAEGAGQDLIPSQEKETDASGNVKLADIGVYLRENISEEFSKGWHAATVKYIDPSYYIRSSPANAQDSIFCTQLAHNAVHAAMAGRTKMIIGLWNNIFTHVPMKAVTQQRKKLDPSGSEWLAVLETTGQPSSMVNNTAK